MKVNLDLEMQKLLPWEYIVTIDGADYKTRAPMLAELIRVQEVIKDDRAKDHGLDEAQKIIDRVVKLARGVFVGKKPAFEGDYLKAVMFLRGYLNYFRQ